MSKPVRRQSFSRSGGNWSLRKARLVSASWRTCADHRLGDPRVVVPLVHGGVGGEEVHVPLPVHVREPDPLALRADDVEGVVVVGAVAVLLLDEGPGSHGRLRHRLLPERGARRGPRRFTLSAHGRRPPSATVSRPILPNRDTSRPSPCYFCPPLPCPEPAPFPSSRRNRSGSGPPSSWGRRSSSSPCAKRGAASSGSSSLFGVSVLLRGVAALALLELPSAAPTILFIALLLQGIAFLGLAAVVVFDLFLPRARVRVPRIARDLAVGLSFVALLLWLFSVHHVDVTGIVATSAVVTAVIGFSLQDTLANVMGGIALQLEGAVAPGDWVKFGDTSGRVRETAWRHTAVETRNGDTLLVPNSVLVKTPLLLLGKAGGRRGAAREALGLLRRRLPDLAGHRPRDRARGADARADPERGRRARADRRPDGLPGELGLLRRPLLADRPPPGRPDGFGREDARPLRPPSRRDSPLQAGNGELRHGGGGGAPETPGEARRRGPARGARERAALRRAHRRGARAPRARTRPCPVRPGRGDGRPGARGARPLHPDARGGRRQGRRPRRPAARRQPDHRPRHLRRDGDADRRAAPRDGRSPWARRSAGAWGRRCSGRSSTSAPPSPRRSRGSSRRARWSSRRRRRGSPRSRAATASRRRTSPS